MVLLQASNRLWTNQSKGVSYYSSIHDSHRIFTSQGKWHQKCGGHKPCSCRIRTQVRLACGQALPQATPPTYLPWGGGLLLLPYTPIIVNFFKVYIYIWVLIGLVSMFSNFLLWLHPHDKKLARHLQTYNEASAKKRIESFPFPL